MRMEETFWESSGLKLTHLLGGRGTSSQWPLKPMLSQKWKVLMYSRGPREESVDVSGIGVAWMIGVRMPANKKRRAV